MPTEKEIADAARTATARSLIERLCIVDPETGESYPVYEPNPDNPGVYRETEDARRIRASG